MAEQFLSLDARERADILRTLAARCGRSTVILEKDIWVCWVLQALFSMPDPHPMAFKGGTSLSKVYRIIDRFSEDVDVTLDYRAFNDGFDPFADGASRNQIRLFSERLKTRVASYIRDVVAPALDGAAERLAANVRHDIHIGNDGEDHPLCLPVRSRGAGRLCPERGPAGIRRPQRHRSERTTRDRSRHCRPDPGPRLSHRNRDGPLTAPYLLGRRRRSSMSHATAAGWRTAPTDSPATGLTSSASPTTLSARPRSPTVTSSKM